MNKAIYVKCLPCTNTLPTRYKAYDRDGNQYTVSDSWKNAPCLYTHAAHEFAMHFGWGGKWVGGGSKEGMVFVKIPHEDNANQFYSAGW